MKTYENILVDITDPGLEIDIYCERIFIAGSDNPNLHVGYASNFSQTRVDNQIRTYCDINVVYDDIEIISVVENKCIGTGFQVIIHDQLHRLISMFLCDKMFLKGFYGEEIKTIKEQIDDKVNSREGCTDTAS